MSDEPTRVIFLASTGRSGSTLLELLLNGLDGVWTTGELYVLPWEISENRRGCGCGKPVGECEMWSTVIARMGPDLKPGGEVSRFRDTYRIAKFFRWVDLLRALRHTPLDGVAGFAAFARENKALFSAVADSLEALEGERPRYVVDSSKLFYRLSWLSQCRGIELRVIHVVRDPRAFVHAKTREAKPGVARNWTAFRMSVRYAVENALIERIAGRMRAGYVQRVRYEDVARHPDRAIRGLCEWLGVEYRSDLPEVFRACENHGVAGNIMRHREGGIALDDRWRQDMDRRLKRLAWLVAGRTARRYGYVSSDMSDIERET